MNNELGTASVGKLLFKLALPAVIAQLVNLLYTVVDRIYIGHIPEVGSLALTGVGLCFPIVTIINAFTMLVAQGGAPHVSMAMGQNQKEKAETILGNCTAALFILAVLITILFSVLGRPMLMLFGASEETIIYAGPYLSIYLLGSVFTMASLGLTLFATCQGYTKYSMISVLIGAVGNTILDPLFIFAFNMGVRGAAIATVISQAASAVFIICFLQSRKSQLHIKFRCLRLNSKILLPVLALGLSPFIMQITEALLNLSFNFSLQKYGGDTAVGAMTIASTVMQMIWIPANGIGQGAQPLISYNYGARKLGRVKDSMKVFMTTVVLFYAFCWLMVELFPQLFILPFNPTDGLLALTKKALRIYVAAFAVFGIQNAAQQFFVSTGQAKVSIFIALLRKAILLIPLIFILPNFFADKVFAVFLAEPVSDLISVTVATILFIVYFRKMILLPLKSENS